MAKRTVSTPRTEDWAQALEDLSKIDFQPLITEAQVFESEAEYNSTWGVKRRIMMIALARSRADMLEAFEKSGDRDPQLYLDMIDHVREYRDHLKAGVEMAETSIARLAGVAMAIGGDSEVAHG